MRCAPKLFSWSKGVSAPMILMMINKENLVDGGVKRSVRIRVKGPISHFASPVHNLGIRSPSARKLPIMSKLEKNNNMESHYHPPQGTEHI